MKLPSMWKSWRIGEGSRTVPCSREIPAHYHCSYVDRAGFDFLIFLNKCCLVVYILIASLCFFSIRTGTSHLLVYFLG